MRITLTMVVAICKSKFASPPSACFRSYKVAACFAENHLFSLCLLRNKNLLKLSAELLSSSKEEIQHTTQWNRRKENVTPIFKTNKQEDPGNCRLASFTLAPGKVIEQIILEIISRHVRDKKDIRSSHHRFTKGQSCLIKLRTFYDERLAWQTRGEQ